MSEVIAVSVLSDALDYLAREFQKRARTRQDHEDAAITLKLIALLRDGCSAPDPFNLACCYALGLNHAKYLYRRAERAEFENLQLLRLIPDYDYSREPKLGRDPTDGRRHYGNNFRNGNRLRNLASEAGAQAESIPSSGADADNAPADRRTGDGPTADASHIAPNRSRTPGRAALLVADCRRPTPKSVRSAAQRFPRALAGSSYFGA